MKKYAFSCILVIFSAVFFLFPSGGECSDLKESARRHYQLGESLFKSEKYSEAQAEYQKALDILKGRLPPDEYVAPVSLIPATVAVSTSGVSAPVAAAAALQAVDRPIKGIAQQQASLKSPLYVISEEDQLSISVWQNKDLDQDVTVRPDGIISLPLLGEIPAAGLTFAQLNKSITERYAEFIRFPQVSISLKKIGGKRYMILGEVMTPGVYNWSAKKSVIEAIAGAGGFNPNAVVSSVIFIEGGLSAPKGRRLNLNKPLLKADMTQNPLVEPETIVFVPKKFIANVNYFITQSIGPLISGYSSSMTTFRPRTSSSSDTNN